MRNSLNNASETIGRMDKRQETIYSVREETEANQKAIEELRDQFERFGSFISELVRLSNGGMARKQGDPSTTEELTRKFFSKK